MGVGQNVGDENWTEFGKRLKVGFRTKIIAGIVVLVPIVVTFLALRLVFQWLDGLAQPLVKQVFQTKDDVFGLGIVLTFALIWLAGLLASNVFGRRLIGRGHTLLARLPIIGSIYSPVRQFIETVVSQKKVGFRQVVLAEYPSEGLWILGFATGEVQLDEEGKIGRCVFVPTSPNPATGWMVIFPPEKVRDTSLTVEEAMQVVMSAGIVLPGGLKAVGTYGLTEEMVRKLQDLEAQSESAHSQSPQPTGPLPGHEPEGSPSSPAQSTKPADLSGPPLPEERGAGYRNRAAE